jgi:hypothetical protein
MSGNGNSTASPQIFIKAQIAPMIYSGVLEKLIHEKT